MQPDSFIGIAGKLLGDLRQAARAQLDLLDLEAQRAGQALALMLAYGMVAGLLLCAAWIGLCAVAVLLLLLVEHDMRASMALLLLVLLNVAGGVGLALGSGVLLFLAWRKLRRPAHPASPAAPV